MHIGSFEVKTKLSALLDRVERGEEFTVTRHGKPVARLIPAASEAERREKRARAITELQSLRDRLKGKGITREEIQEWIAEGRR